jgi:hypothetical protein
MTDPSEPESSSIVSRSILDQELLSTYATAPEEEKDQGDVFMEAVRLLEGNDALRTAFKIGLRIFKATYFEAELNDCLKEHAELLHKNSRTDDQEAIARYVDDYCRSLANTITRHVFEDYSQTFQLIQSNIGQQSESPSDKMTRYYLGSISTNPEELPISSASRVQKPSEDELPVDFSTMTSNEEFFLSEDAFKRFLVKMEGRVQKDSQIKLTVNLKVFKFTWLCNKLAYLGLMCHWGAFVSKHLEKLCRPKVRPGYQRLFWKCVSLLI